MIKKVPSIVTLLVLTLVTVVSWITFDVYRAIVKAPVVKIDAQTLKELNPSLDTDSIQTIVSRQEDRQASFVSLPFQIASESGGLVTLPTFEPTVTAEAIVSTESAGLETATPEASATPTATPTASP